MSPGASLIDVHTHVVPAGLPFGHDVRFASIDAVGTSAEVLVGGAVFRVVTQEAWDVEARLAAMDAHGVAMQAISPMPELFSYWAEPAVGSAFCAALNEAIAEMVAASAGRLVGLGAVPLQDLDRAIAAVGHVRDLGLVGIEIGSNVLGACAGGTRFLPFFQAVADAGLCVFVHAFHPPYWDCCADPPMAAAVNFPPEVGTAVAALLANGIVQQSPGLRVCASHGGGTFPLHLPRMQAFWQASPERAAWGGSVADAARALWYDSMTYSTDALRALVDLVGASQVVVGSDAPFMPDPPGSVVEALHAEGRLSDADRATIRVASALDLLGMTELPGGTA